MDILQHISDLLLTKKSEIISFSLTAPYRYKIYKIAKETQIRRELLLILRKN